MSEIWLGAFLAMGLYWTLETIASVCLFGREYTVDGSKIAVDFVLMILFYVLANLVYLGVIL